VGFAGISSLTAQTPISGAMAGQWNTIRGLSQMPLDPDNFSAVPTMSTEARYSAGIFTTDVDDFIDVNAYDPNIGTFLFLGGFPSVVDNTANPFGVDVTNRLTDPTNTVNSVNTTIDDLPAYTISGGFAKSFEKFYLGVYLGGSVVHGWGASDSDPKRSFSEGIWNTKLAVLIGTAKIGGIRLDLVMNNVTDRTTRIDHKTVGDGSLNMTSGDGITVALRWGNTIGSKDLDVHALLGYTFADYRLTSDAAGDNRTRVWSDAEWVLGGGLAWDLNRVSTLEADLYLGGDFGTLTRGQTNDVDSGGFGFAAGAGLKNIIEPVRGLEIGFTPTLGIILYGEEAIATGNTVTIFDLTLGFDAGIKFRLPRRLNKFSLITGASLNFFNWNVVTHYASPTETAWLVQGITWKPESLTQNSTLGLGLVFAPNNRLSVGFGLNALLDNLLVVNVMEMTVKPGKFFADDQPFGGPTGGPFGGLFLDKNNDPITFDLTVSYKF
jgi:hypothetical protein